MFNILEVSCEATKQCSCLIMPALSLIKQFINIVKIAIPIILIVMGMIDLAKAMMSADDGAMIYVVVEELIPESQTNEKKDLMALFTLIGFSVMMILDISLG